jgi:uncharacterized protein YodC (DUF2158 family)
MTFEPGQVVTLKSGSQAMTVVSVAEEDIACVWIGEEGEFFRQTIPSIALTAVDADEAETEDEDEDEADSDAEDEHEADEDTTPSRKRRAA